jgi:hypothetical protein
MWKSWALCLLVLAACSSGTGGGATLSGAGSFTPNAQISAVQDGGTPPNLLLIAIADSDQLTCASIEDGGIPNGQLVGISVFLADGGPVQTGPYAMVDPNATGALPNAGGYATLTRVVVDADAGLTTIANSSSGTLNLTTVETSYAGNFSAVLYNAVDGGAFGTLTGTFDTSPLCIVH